MVDVGLTAAHVQNTNVRSYAHFKFGKLWLKRVAAPMISSFVLTYREDFLPNEFIASLKTNAEFLKLLTFRSITFIKFKTMYHKWN